MSRSFKSANTPQSAPDAKPRAPKRSLKAPLIGLGAGAAILGGFAWYGSGTTCTEGKVAENLQQCRALVGWQYANLCDNAFSTNPESEQLGVIDRGAFIIRRDNQTPAVEGVLRRSGDPKWRKSFSNDVAEPFRESCSSARSSSGHSSSGGSGGGRSTSALLPAAAAHAVARGGFGSTGHGFFGGGG